MLDKEPILALAAAGRAEAERLSQEHGKPITVDGCALIMLARIAIHKPDGEEYMREHVRIIVDDMIRRAPEATAYKYEYEPADADERRQSGHVPPNISFLSRLSRLQLEYKNRNQHIKASALVCWFFNAQNRAATILREGGLTMENPALNPAATLAPPYPWYDDRVETVRKEYVNPWADDDMKEPEQYTPREIYDYLDQRVWKQEEAKRAASVIMYQCLHGIKSNALFAGPTGCGKTHVWRCLQKLYPGRIVIEDASNITMDGWKGGKKWSSLLNSPVLLNPLNRSILVLDEADKMLAPKFSYSENVSHGVQSEGLTILEGTRVEVKEGSVVHTVDTSRISFVLCGAFSNKARDIAQKSSGSRIGFGATQKIVQPYARPLDERSLIEHGVLAELMGRIQRIVNLQPMTADDYFNMTANGGSVLARIGEQYKANIRLTPQKRRELAELASRTGLGVRGMENQIRQLMDEAIFDHCEQRSFEF